MFRDVPKKVLLMFFAITVAVGIVCYGLGGASSSFLAESDDAPPPVATPAPTVTPPRPAIPEDHDPYAEDRTKPSYIGDIGSVKLDRNVVYWMSHESRLIETGNYEWFFEDANAPVFSNQEDAGLNPFQIELVWNAPWFMNDGGAGLKLTLPHRPDYQLVGVSEDGKLVDHLMKDLSTPLWDVRDSNFRHRPLVPITQVVPAPNHTLADYYDVDQQLTSKLPVGQSGFINTGDLQIIKGTQTGYIDDYHYWKVADDEHSSFVRLTNTGQGLVVCTDVPERKTHALDYVSADFVPVRTALPVRLDCG